MFEWWKKSQQLLGMNARNLNYIRPYNKKSAKRFADDKLFSKRILKKQSLPVPDLILKIRNYEELERCDWFSLPSSFALKPNRGFGGEGIIVVYGKKKNRPDAWVKADGSLVTIEDLKTHIRNILDGSFSLANTPDIAFFEERVKLLKLFKPYTFKGIPDIRVIVFNKIPIMAMLRIPTKESGGKANLHQGAIGVGIDMASGVTTTAIYGKAGFIEKVPGTRLLLSGLRIPYWKDILRLAVRSQEVSDLGFLGADIAIDQEKGPMILELNARPGLSIQVANMSGLKERLDRISGLKIKSLERGIRVGRELFGGEIEEEVEDISGRKVIGSTAVITLLGKNDLRKTVEGKIDTGAGFSSLDIELASQLGFEKTVVAYKEIQARYSFDELNQMTKEARWEIFKNIPEVFDLGKIHSASGSSFRPIVKLGMLIDDLEISASMTLIDRSQLQYPIIIGKKNLGKFLIDVTK